MGRQIYATLLIGALSIFSTTALADGPFGVDLSAKIAAYPMCKKMTGVDGDYECSTLPKPHPDFNFYLIKYFDDIGICGVSAASKTIQVNSFGEELIALIDDISSQLSLKYGTPRKVDGAAGIMSAKQYWMIALMRHERVYAYVWEKKLPPGLSSIQLEALAESSDSGKVILIFKSSHAAECTAKIKKLKAGAF